MLYPLLTFFGLQYFFANYWISTISALAVFVWKNTSKPKDCGCSTKKPQNEV